jgi:hypothetical protein
VGKKRRGRKKQAFVQKENASPADRRPRALARVVAESGEHLRPVFSFAKIDRAYEGEWGWNMLREEDDVFGFLCTLSASSWHELRAMASAGHRMHHWQPIGSLVKAAQDRLVELMWDDQDEMFRFRQGATARLWGFEIDGVFYVIWWDPHHRVYPAEPN